MSGYYVEQNGATQKFLSRKERRAIIRKLSSKAKTEEEALKNKITDKILAQRSASVLKDNQEIVEMNREAERNASILKNFVEKFGEEKGKELYLQNMELKSKAEEKKIKKEQNV